MEPTTYEMNFHWDDAEEASYRKTPTHIQNGYLKVWKVEHETNETFNERAERIFFDKIYSIHKVSGIGGWGIDKNTFPFLK